MKIPEVWARFDPELGEQSFPGALVGERGFALAAASVASDQEHAGDPLIRRIGGGQVSELGGDPLVLPEPQLSLQAFDERGTVLLPQGVAVGLQPSAVGDWRAVHVCEGTAARPSSGAPLGQGLPQQRRSLGVVISGQRPGAGAQIAEPAQIDVLPADQQLIAAVVMPGQHLR